MDISITGFLINVFHGLVYAMLLFMVASGLTIVFGLMGILNLAHASFCMLGTYFGYSLFQWSENFWLALILAPIISFVLGTVIEQYLLRPVHASGHLFELLLTIGFSMIILEAVKWGWGPNPLPFESPKSLSGSIIMFGKPYPVYRLFVLGFSIIAMSILTLVLYKSRLGMVVRAAVENPNIVSTLGINTNFLFSTVFGLGTALAALAGVIAAPLWGVYPGLADAIGFDVFVVVVVGGLGSFFGAVVSSLLIGELQSFGIMFLPRFSMVLIVLLMAIVLSIRPQGLFGDRS